MIYIRFEAMPSQRIADEKRAAGAFVNCWVNSDDAAHAEATARQWLADEGWTVVGVEARRSVGLNDRGGNDDPYMREALERGGSMVFHKWVSGERPLG
jgi:hypothetical protein